MRTHISIFLLFLVASIAGCSLFYTEIGDYDCPTGGTTLTYANFGADFMNRYCQSCHGSNATDRAGAPGEFIFDTPDQVKRHAARIFVRSADENDSMPPGPDDPDLGERKKLAEWLACGAP